MARFRWSTFASVMGAFAVALSSEAASAQSSKPVVVATVMEKEITTGQTFVGTVLPTHRATVGSAVSGRVVEFPVEVGQRVEQKQPLARILTETISLELAAAEAELVLRKELLRELENGSRPEEIEQSEAQLLSAEARNRYAQARLTRTQSLHERGSVTDETFEEIRSLAAAALQGFHEAEASYRLVEAGPREEKLAQAKAQVAMQEAAVAKLKDQIAKHTVITRFAGYVVAEFTEAGAWVDQGDPVAEVVALDQVEVESQVPENAIPFVKVGDEVRVEIPALPDRLITGKVISINPQADVRARTFPVRVRVQNEISESGPVIKAGMFARVVLPTGPVRKALLVPKDALVLGGTRPLVFVAQPDPKQADRTIVQPVGVTPGVAFGSSIEIDGGLRSGQLVVTMGNERLRPGDVVEPTHENKELAP